MNAVTIDSTWISNAGAAPYLLSQDHTVYTLGVDVNVTTSGYNGPVFKITARDVKLELNGHTVKVQGESYPQITDGHVYRRVSQYTERANNANDVHMFGGTYWDGSKAKAVCDPATASQSFEYPLVVPYADTK